MRWCLDKITSYMFEKVTEVFKGIRVIIAIFSLKELIGHTVIYLINIIKLIGHTIYLITEDKGLWYCIYSS